jgi:hypothetical protein
VVIAFLVCLLIGGSLAIFAVVSNQQANNAACEEANDVRTVLTRVLSRSRTLSAQNEESSQVEKEVAADFYTEALELLKTHHC